MLPLFSGQTLKQERCPRPDLRSCHGPPFHVSEEKGIRAQTEEIKRIEGNRKGSGVHRSRNLCVKREERKEVLRLFIIVLPRLSYNGIANSL